jgi:hypothetical protein
VNVNINISSINNNIINININMKLSGCSLLLQLGCGSNIAAGSAADLLK